MTQPNTDLEQTVRSYLEAFQAQDVERCLGFFADEATVKFLQRTYQGAENLEAWHRERFDANLRVLKIEGVNPTPEGVDVDIIATSKVLQSWGMPELGSRVRFVFADDRISELTFQMSRSGGGNYIWARK